MEESIKNSFKQNCRMSIVESIAMGALGVILFIAKEEAVKVLAYMLGILFVCVGVYKIINYMLNKGKTEIYDYDWVFGICACIFGVVTVIYSPELITLFRICIAMWIIFSSLVRMTASVRIKDFDMPTWTYSLIFAIIMFASGLIILLNEGVLVTALASAMIIFAVIDIIEDVIFIKNI